VAEETCECGHTRDEHSDDGECMAEFEGLPCECFYFDEAS
jgi:hypothetical protein